MGIDLIAGGRNTKVSRTHPKSLNPYTNILSQAYGVVSRRSVDNKLAKRVQKHLTLSNTNRPCVTLSTLAKTVSTHAEEIPVVVATVTNDDRLVLCPKMTIAALKFSKTARTRIEKAGGRCMTLDELLEAKPTGAGCILLRGKRTHRVVVKQYGAAGLPGSHTKPKGDAKGARGQRGRHNKSHPKNMHAA
ncbi:ribosomal protein L18e [Kipferlia bialata]|uniref:Ribosomal protein L18e n=1 Tax=Kipferlia bialata TaxID=797122 RepID=A0A391NNL0_9EUKA|nr:ribosomal protein L18e [Kipferlia bialata]|eukprot:g8959.t1